MARPLRRALRRLQALLAGVVDVLAGWSTVLLLKVIRWTDPDRISNFGGWVMRRVGPWVPEHKLGRANLKAAFPEKSDKEIEEILLGVWENLGRVGAEYAHLDRIWDLDLENPGPSRISFEKASYDIYFRLANDGKPALVFAAHLANWELPAVGAARYGIESVALYRMPNIRRVAEAIREIRAGSMGMLVPTGRDAVIAAASALERGAHVGMLVDQHFTKGVDVTFFGRTCKANPTIARLARLIDCPIHGTRAIRLPGNRFHVEITEAITPPRSADGEIDIQGTMQAITGIVEGWVREHPEQWLWLHRRWR